MQSAQRYYLAFPRERAAYPPLVKFRNWIVEELAREMAS
jgi:LysR family transcriptional regulator, glycine cleavage system transcriptional activator